MGLGRKQFREIGPIGSGLVGPMQLGYQIGHQLGMGGGSDANLWIYRGALRIPGVWRATNLVANLLAQSPWTAFTSHGQDTPVEITPQLPLLYQPSPPDTRLSTLRASMIDRIHDGNALFIIAARDSQGRPSAVWPVPVSFVGIRRITPANMSTTMLPIGAIEYQVGTQTFSSTDVIHVKGPCAPGALRGAGVLELFLGGTFETAHEQEHEAQKMSRHGVPAGILKFGNDSATANDPKKLRQAGLDWLSARDHNGVAVMNSAVDFTPLAWNPNDMQMIEARQFTLLQIANIMGVPPKFVGAATGDGLTYATSETGGKELLRDTMGVYFEEYDQAFSLALPRGTEVKFNRDAFTKADMLQRYQAYQIGINAGFLRPDADVRTEEHLSPDPKLDEDPTALVQKNLNKALPITDEGLKQVLGNGTGFTPSPAPVQAVAQRLPIPALTSGQRASELEWGRGHPLFTFWAEGKGFTEWAMSPTPWTTLTGLLASKGVPAGQIAGLATNLMEATPAGRALFAAHHGGK